MKRAFIVSIVVVAMVVSASPSFGNGWPHSRHHHWHGWGYYSGWDAAAIVGGSILLGTFLGMAMSNNYPYAPPPQRVYVYPEQGPYAAPDPEFLERYSHKKETENYPGPVYSYQGQGESSPGSWVIVPGQWIQGIWVPEHRVWVLDNP